MVDDVIRMSKSKYFGAYDLMNAFMQVRMDPASQHLTAINMPWGCFEWTIMPCNSPATWTQVINKALGELIGDIVYAYVDDLTQFNAMTLKEHIANC